MTTAEFSQIQIATFSMVYPTAFKILYHMELKREVEEEYKHMKEALQVKLLRLRKKRNGPGLSSEDDLILLKADYFASDAECVLFQLESKSEIIKVKFYSIKGTYTSISQLCGNHFFFQKLVECSPTNGIDIYAYQTLDSSIDPKEIRLYGDENLMNFPASKGYTLKIFPKGRTPTIIPYDISFDLKRFKMEKSYVISPRTGAAYGPADFEDYDSSTDSESDETIPIRSIDSYYPPGLIMDPPMRIPVLA